MDVRHSTSCPRPEQRGPLQPMVSDIFRPVERADRGLDAFEAVRELLNMNRQNLDEITARHLSTLLGLVEDEIRAGCQAMQQELSSNRADEPAGRAKS